MAEKREKAGRVDRKKEEDDKIRKRITGGNEIHLSIDSKICKYFYR